MFGFSGHGEKLSDSRVRGGNFLVTFVSRICPESKILMFPDWTIPTVHTESACRTLTLTVDNLSDMSHFKYFMSVCHARG